ncbi:MAG: Cryptochrome-like protein cry2, partial [Bacteroidota bacterium]
MTESEQILFNCKIGVDYPSPIVDIEESQKFATQLMWGFKKSKDAKEEGARILKTHVKSRPVKKKTSKKK